MALQLPYPLTRYDPSPIIDLSRKEERDRLSAAGVKAFLNIMEHWGVRDEDARQLLSLTNGPFYEMKKKANTRKLDQDRLMRVSQLIGIFKALNILHGKELADKWIRLPNTNRIFHGRTPLEYMIRGGLPAMQTVRHLLDARSAGF